MIRLGEEKVGFVVVVVVHDLAAHLDIAVVVHVEQMNNNDVAAQMLLW